MYCKFSTFKFSNSKDLSIMLDLYDDYDDICCYIMAHLTNGVYKIKYTIRSKSEQTYIDFLIEDRLVVIEHLNKSTKFYKLKLTQKALLNVL